MKYKTASLIIALGVILFLLTACGTPQPATTPPDSPTDTIPPPTETPVPWVHPSGRAHHQLVYDANCDQVILFGGTIGDYLDPAYATNDVWAYDLESNTWTELTPWSGPKAMTSVAAAFDAESNRTILFGGGIIFMTRSTTDEREIALGEAWVYDCLQDTWTEVQGGPPKRFGHQMVYHSRSDKVLIFAGGSMRAFNDTWIYDFNTDNWMEMDPTTIPPSRYYYSMAYDVESDKVLVWGGKDLPDKKMWAYDFSTDDWEKLVPSEGPVVRNFPSIVYDSNADRVIMFGGLGKDDTWTYDYNSNTWTEMKPDTNPGKLARHAMVYNPVLDKTILFGGRFYESEQFVYMDETWVYDLNTNTWTNMTPNQ